MKERGRAATPLLRGWISLKNTVHFRATKDKVQSAVAPIIEILNKEFEIS